MKQRTLFESAVVGATVLLASFAAGCHEPQYSLPDGAVAFSVQVVATTPGTTADLGNDATQLCVLRSNRELEPTRGRG